MNEGDGSETEVALCEIGSVPLPDGADWLIGRIAGFQASYGDFHPYLAVALCIAGMLMNMITVIVLTRPSMISPVNVLLCAVALCDILVMGSYLVFVVHFLLAAASRCLASDYSYAWALFTMFHAHASVIFHATSIWLTVSLAQIRVLTIRRATIGPTTNISGRFTAILAIITCLIMTIVNLPNFLTFEVMEVPSVIFLPCLRSPTADEINSTSSHNFLKNLSKHSDSLSLNADLMETLTNENYFVGNTTFMQKKRAAFVNISATTPVLRLAEGFITTTTTPILQEMTEKTNESMETLFTVRAQENDCMKLKLAFWSNGMIFKVVPCLLLTVSIVALLNIIADVSHKRRNLAQVMKKKVPKDHTTPMLAAVLSIFLIAELPQGVMLVLTGIFSSETFHKKIYLPLGDFMDILSLLNSAIGFLIYVGMSRKFRSVFFQLFFSCLRWTFIVKEARQQKAKRNALKALMQVELSETLHLLEGWNRGFDSRLDTTKRVMLANKVRQPQRSKSQYHRYHESPIQRYSSIKSRRCIRAMKVDLKPKQNTISFSVRRVAAVSNSVFKEAHKIAVGRPVISRARSSTLTLKIKATGYASIATSSKDLRVLRQMTTPEQSSTASTLNAYGGLCAAATAAAAVQLGSHLMFFDCSSAQTVLAKQPSQKTHFLSPKDAYLTPTSKKPPILKDSNSAVEPRQTAGNEFCLDSKPAKRISFNLPLNDTQSTTSKSGLLPFYFAVKEKIEQETQQSTSQIMPDSNSTIDHETVKVENRRKAITVTAVKKNGLVGVFKRMFWPDQEKESQIYGKNFNCIGSTSPQRKSTLLQTEINLVDTFY